MSTNNINLESNKVFRKRVINKVVIILLMIILIVLSFFYFVLYIVYDNGRFTITLDDNLSSNKNMYLSDNKEFKKSNTLSASTLEYMDNISIKWLPSNIDDEADGSHNGDNYIAYTFYLSNGGKSAVHYWYEVDINDSVKNVDEAVRFMIIHNGTKKVYAKRNKTTLEPEEGTISFVDKKIAILEQRKNFKPGEVDKFTIVMWIEGDDPDCLNDLLGGEIKFGMNIFEESYKSGVSNEKK